MSPQNQPSSLAQPSRSDPHRSRPRQTRLGFPRVSEDPGGFWPFACPHQADSSENLSPLVLFRSWVPLSSRCQHCGGFVVTQPWPRRSWTHYRSARMWPGAREPETKRSSPLRPPPAPPFCWAGTGGPIPRWTFRAGCSPEGLRARQQPARPQREVKGLVETQGFPPLLSLLAEGS